MSASPSQYGSPLTSTCVPRDSLTFLLAVAVALTMLVVVQAMPTPFPDMRPGGTPGYRTPHPLVYDGE
ncbi:hypothetical protein E2C01_091612 [Portunus trituberculatus]|uniref:Uncharacterized protein n=1 Tax=Portunus trituberculatus TaxID=210409 RepID=A0A5B7JP25_PORTR|nr:hypothetical protein [Portunus trituberculatus]